MMSSKIINIPGLEIAAKTWGDNRLPPMLALHGWLDNANSFDLLAPYLADRFHIIAVDFPGHGLSSHLPECNHYHFVDGVISIIQIIKALDYPAIHLLGHSMGACFASLVAGVINQRILSLSLIEGLGPFSSPEDTCREQLAHYVQTTLISEPIDAKPYKDRETAAIARAKRGHVSLEIARILCNRGVKEENNHFFWRHDRRLLKPTLIRMTEGQILSCLEAINAKTTLIWADNGFAFESKLMDQRVAAVKNIKVCLLSGGHHIHMEKPDAVAEHLVF